MRKVLKSIVLVWVTALFGLAAGTSGDWRSDADFFRSIDEMRERLQYQTTSGQWVEVYNNPQDVYLAEVKNKNDTTLSVYCLPNQPYGAAL